MMRSLFLPLLIVLSHGQGVAVPLPVANPMPSDWLTILNSLLSEKVFNIPDIEQAIGMANVNMTVNMTGMYCEKLFFNALSINETYVEDHDHVMNVTIDGKLHCVMDYDIELSQVVKARNIKGIDDLLHGSLDITVEDLLLVQQIALHIADDHMADGAHSLSCSASLELDIILDTIGGVLEDGGFNLIVDDIIEPTLEEFLPPAFCLAADLITDGLLNQTLSNLAEFFRDGEGLNNESGSYIYAIVCLLALLLAVSWCIWKYCFAPFGSLPSPSAEQEAGINDMQKEGVEKAEIVEEYHQITNPAEYTDCVESYGCYCRKEDVLFTKDAVPNWCGLLIPVMIVVCIALFISAHTSVGASVDAYIKVKNKSGVVVLDTIMPGLFTFGLADSINDFFEARSWILFLMVLVFSGAWPYIKCLMLAATWLLAIPPIHRDRWLYWLDILGKYSFADMLILVILMVAFRMHLTADIVPGLEGLLTIDVIVMPKWGTFGFVIAVLTIDGLTHIVKYYSKITQRSIHHGEHDDEYRSIYKDFVWWKSLIIPIGLVGTFILLNTGAGMKSIRFIYDGLAGVFIDEPVQEYGQFDIANNMGSSTGEQFMKAIFYVLTYTFPVLHIIMLIVLWFVPMKGAWKRALVTICEVLQSQGCLEVFILGLFAAALQCPAFVGFMVENICSGFINQVLKLLLGGTDIKPSCLEVSVELMAGGWLLLAFMIFYVSFAGYSQRLCEDSLEERIDIPHKHEEETDDVETKKPTNANVELESLNTTGGAKGKPKGENV